MTLSQIKAQVEALCRKYAPQLEVYRLSKVAVKFCDEMHDALTNPKSGPVKDPWDWNRVLLKRMRERRISIEFRFRPGRIMAVHDYLKHCLEKLHVLPQSVEILRKLLPESAARGLIPRPIEDPMPLCAVKRDLKNQGENDDASNLGLSDLIEHWRRNDRGWGWGGRSGEGGPPRRLPEKVTDHGPSTAVGDGVEGAGKGDPRDGCRRESVRPRPFR